jgi:probable HAF family extracellular repeat protein
VDSIGHTACRLVTTALALVTALGALSAQAQKFSVTTLQNLPDSVSVQGVAINNSGQVAGDSVDANGVSFAVLWNGTTPTVVAGQDDYGNAGPQDAAFVSGMNDLGLIVGYDVFNIFPKNFADVWGGDPSGFCSGGEDGSGWSTANAINDAGQIVGMLGGDIPPTPVLWPNSCIANSDVGSVGGPQLGYGADPTSINNKGEVVGFYYLEPPYLNNPQQHAVRFDSSPNDMGTLGGTNSGANQINDRGYVVGWADIANNRSHAALWGPHTKANDLGTLGGKTSSANGINTQGDAVGSSQTLSGASHAVLWTHLHYLAEDLNNEIGALNKQITLTDAVGTNDHCQVLANGYDNKTQVTHIYVLSLINPKECDVVTEDGAVPETAAAGAEATAR